jgi:hypothetical protein
MQARGPRIPGRKVVEPSNCQISMQQPEAPPSNW